MKILSDLTKLKYGFWGYVILSLITYLLLVVNVGKEVEGVQRVIFLFIFGFSLVIYIFTLIYAVRVYSNKWVVGILGVLSMPIPVLNIVVLGYLYFTAKRYIDIYYYDMPEKRNIEKTAAIVSKQNRLVEQIRERMKSKSTEELLTIWEENDRETWSNEAFEAIKQLLLERGEKLPLQKELNLERLIKEVADKYTTYLNKPRLSVGMMKKMIKKASNFLLFWGCVNILIGLLSGFSFLDEFSSRGFDIYILIFMGSIIGTAMVLTSFVGFIRKPKPIILLAGIFLLMIGLSNIFYVQIANSVLGQYGLYGKESNPMWWILGILQIFGGGQLLLGYLGSKSAGDVSKEAEFENNPLLREFVGLPPNPERGLIEFEHLEEKEKYKAILLDDRAIGFAEDLSDYVVLEKKDRDKWKFGGGTLGNEVSVTDIEGKSLKLAFNEPSLSCFKQWAEK